MATAERELTKRQQQQELAGLDALESFTEPGTSRLAKIWALTWPKLLAIGMVVLFWQIVVWSGWKPEFVLPSPFTVFQRLGEMIHTTQLWKAVGVTMTRAVKGYALALVIGSAVGLLVARSRVMRAAVGSMISGLQTMPSVAWFPLAMALFKITEGAIMFVVVLGAAPSIANGLVHGVDHIPPVLLRAGKVLGARGISEYRHIVIPAALPSFVAGLKQGWAFSWRSLMAGELLVVIANKQSLGFLLDVNRQLADNAGLIAIMIVILVIGITVDALFFAQLDKRLRRRWGLALD